MAEEFKIDTAAPKVNEKVIKGMNLNSDARQFIKQGNDEVLYFLKEKLDDNLRFITQILIDNNARMFTELQLQTTMIREMKEIFDQRLDAMSERIDATNTRLEDFYKEFKNHTHESNT